MRWAVVLSELTWLPRAAHCAIIAHEVYCCTTPHPQHHSARLLLAESPCSATTAGGAPPIHLPVQPPQLAKDIFIRCFISTLSRSWPNHTASCNDGTPMHTELYLTAACDGNTLTLVQTLLMARDAYRRAPQRAHHRWDGALGITFTWVSPLPF